VRKGNGWVVIMVSKGRSAPGGFCWVQRGARSGVTSMYHRRRGGH
jgi:hypothetical protein